MKRFDAVFFDIDGTLVDSNDAHAQAWSQAAKKFGYDRDVEFFRPLIGMGGDSILPKIDAALSPDTPTGKQISDERKRLMLGELGPKVRAFPQSRELLQACRALDAACIVATSSTPEELERSLHIAEISELMHTRVTGEEAEHAKPASDIVALALQKSKVAADRALMIGDTAYDIEAASKVGVATVAVRCGGSSDERLSGAIAIFDDPADILLHLDEIFSSSR